MSDKWKKPDCAPYGEWVNVAAKFSKSESEHCFYVKSAIFEFGVWFCGDDEVIDSVVAWQPLPKYQDGDENE